MRDNLCRRSFGQNMAAMNNIRPVDQSKGLPHVVIGNEHPNPATFQVPYKILYVADSDRVYACLLYTSDAADE